MGANKKKSSEVELLGSYARTVRVNFLSAIEEPHGATPRFF